MCINTTKRYACGYESCRYKKTGSECYLNPLPKHHPKTSRCIEVYSVCGRCYSEQLQGRFPEVCMHSRGIEVSWEEDFFVGGFEDGNDTGRGVYSGRCGGQLRVVN